MNLIRAGLLVLGLTAAQEVRRPVAEGKSDQAQDKKPVPKFTLGKETTFVTGPLDKDGYIDYAAALNERLGKGITPKTNAVVLFWTAFSASPQISGMQAEYWKLLGIEPPKADTGFIGIVTYARDHLKRKFGMEAQDIYDQQDRAIQRPWTAKELPHIANWLKHNEKPLSIVVEASRRPDYFNPMVPPRSKQGSRGLLNAPGAPDVLCRDAAEALVARAMLHVGEGRTEEAWQDLLAAHRIGRLVSRGGSLLDGLVGFAIDRIASTADVAFLESPRLTSQQALACLRDLRELPPMASMADKVNLAERFKLLDVVQLVERQGVGYLDEISGGKPQPADPLSKKVFERFDWHPVLRKANKNYDRLEVALRAADRAVIVKVGNAIDREISMSRTHAQTLGESIGDILIGMMLPSSQKARSAADRSEQIQRNLQVAFALSAYQRDRGAYPKQLAELAPKYLKEIPNDLFSGKPLIYRPEKNGYLLYSVGPNGVDDGGRWTDDDPSADDPSIRIPQPALKPHE
jgi:hypothetical protein